MKWREEMKKKGIKDNTVPVDAQLQSTTKNQASLSHLITIVDREGEERAILRWVKISFKKDTDNLWHIHTKAGADRRRSNLPDA